MKDGDGRLSLSAPLKGRSGRAVGLSIPPKAAYFEDRGKLNAYDRQFRFRLEDD